jgi:hypothetical protein
METCLDRQWYRRHPAQFFVANVNVNSGGLDVFVDRFGFGYVLPAECSLRMVVPKMIVFSSLILLSERSFLFKPFSPSAEHLAYLVQLFRECCVLVVRQAFVFPCQLQKEFHAVEL